MWDIYMRRMRSLKVILFAVSCLGGSFSLISGDLTWSKDQRTPKPLHFLNSESSIYAWRSLEVPLAELSWLLFVTLWLLMTSQITFLPPPKTERMFNSVNGIWVLSKRSLNVTLLSFAFTFEACWRFSIPVCLTCLCWKLYRSLM